MEQIAKVARAVYAVLISGDNGAVLGIITKLIALVATVVPYGLVAGIYRREAKPEKRKRQLLCDTAMQVGEV